ncbi:MAG: hypothetical protein AAFY88_01840, partial [Acidobacteriota bacterium]
RHPGARHKLDAFTENRKVRQVRAVLGNLGLAGGIRGKDARYAFKSQVAAEKKWNARFGLDEKPEAGGGESSKAQCCADGASPFPANRHDASRHDPAANRPDAGASPSAENAAPPVGAQGDVADPVPAPTPVVHDDTADAAGRRLTDGERARHRSEARRIFDARRPSTRSLAEIRGERAARHARRTARLGELSARSRPTADVAGKVSARQRAALAGAGIGAPATGQSMARHLRGAVSADPAMGAVNRRSIMFHAAGSMGTSRAERLERHMAGSRGSHGPALAGLADRRSADAQAEAVGDFFASVEQ